MDQPLDSDARAVIFPMWAKNAEWRDSLARRAAHKALDIVEDDVTIAPTTTTNVTQSGLGAKAVAAVAAAAGLPGLVAAAAMALQGGGAGRPEPVIVPNVSPAAASAVDSSYDVIFYDAQGRVIEGPDRWPGSVPGDKASVEAHD